MVVARGGISADIRFGLAAVKGVGDNVVAAIIQAREEGGRFESPYASTHGTADFTAGRPAVFSSASISPKSDAVCCFEAWKTEKK